MDWTPYDDFDTSPVEDSPFSDFLTTPVLPLESEANMMTGPIMDEHGYEGMQLFSDMSTHSLESQPAAAPPARPKFPSSEKMYTISPSTPALDIAGSVFPSPSPNPNLPLFREPGLPSSATTIKRRIASSSATGTRRNITPSSLVPLDAPTQPRKYLTPSMTSRKDVPAVWKKRSRPIAFGQDDADEYDELGELPAGATQQEMIEHKRRQNTIAARKSRKRKLEHTLTLEKDVEMLRKDREMWKTRAGMLVAILRGNGIEFDDEGWEWE